MSTQVKHRRGNTTEIENFTAAVAEIIINTDTSEMIVGDGVSEGGRQPTRKPLNSVAAMKATKNLRIGDYVSTISYIAGRNKGGANYTVVSGGTGTDDGGSFINLDNGLQAKLIPGSVIDVAQFGADNSAANTSDKIQAALDYGKPVVISDTYRATGLTVDTDNQNVYFHGGRLIRPDAITAVDIIEVTADNCVIYDAYINGAGETDPGGDISQSLAGIRLGGKNNKAVRCLVFGVGKLLTSGDQGANNQVGVGYTGASNDPQEPNIFQDCVAHTNGNYGFNPRENVMIIRGGTYNNGTNGIGNRFCRNFHVDGTYIGGQYKGNPDTNSVGMTLDTESVGHPDYQKLSRDCSFRNMIIEAQESYSISCSFYADVIFENIEAKGDVLIQSSTPQVAPDLGVDSRVNITNMTVDRSFTALNHEKLVLNTVTQKGLADLDLRIDAVEDCDIYNLTCSSSLAQLIRIDNLTIRKLQSTGFISFDTIGVLDCLQIDMEGTTPVTDQQALRFSNTKGSCTGIIKRYGYPISMSSGSSDLDFSGFRFIECGAADGPSDQNACINFKNTSGLILNNLRFDNCTNRALYATNASNFIVNSLNIDNNSSCDVTIEGSSDSFVLTGWNYLGTGTLRVFAGASMDGSEVNANHIASTVTISAYPAGPTRYNGGVLQVWNAAAWVNV